MNKKEEEMEIIDKIDGHLVIVMAIEHYNPLSIIRSLGKNGIRPVYIAIKGKGKIASCSRYVSKCHFANTVEEAYELLIREYGDQEKAPFILCTDDKTISLLDAHYSDLKDRFIFFNAGEDNRINEFMNKFRILEMAEKHGLNILKTHYVKRGAIPEDVEYPLITKSMSPTAGGWKSDVHICYNEAELKEAYASIRSEMVILQKYIDKKNEYTLEGFSIRHGEESFFSISVTYNYIIKGYYSPYLTVGKADNEYINSCLSDILKEIGFEGIFEIEFLIDQDDTLYFEEINFRNSPWSYPSAALGRPVPELWMRSMAQNHIPVLDNDVPKHFTAMIEPVDYAKRVQSGMISQAQWLYDFKKTDVTFYYDPDDPDPYYLMMDNFDFYS